MKRLVAALIGLVALLGTVLPVAAQESATTGPSQLVVHSVDSRDAQTVVTVLADDYAFDSETVQLTQNGESIELGSIGTASSKGAEQEIVFVLDVHSSLAAGAVFESVRDELASAVRGLPAGTTVSVVSAGLVSSVIVEPTTDLTGAAEGIANLRRSSATTLFEGIKIAGGLLSNSSSTHKTVVIFSGTVDPSETVNPLEAAQSLVSKGAQVIAVRFQAGDDRLSNIVDVAGGLTFGTSEASGVGSAMQDAVLAASDRFVLTFDGVSEAAERGDSQLTIGAAAASFSYAGDRLTTSTAGLAPAETVSEGGLGALQNSTGLYIVLVVGTLSIGVAIFALGSIFAGGESRLEGLMSRYSGEGDSELDEDESAIVQTALIKRAVEMSESFAEDRGFLAKIESLLERARLPLRPGEAMSIFVIGTIVGAFFGLMFFGGLFGTLILGGITAFVQISAVQFMAKRRVKQFEAQLPDTLQLMASTLRAGYSLPQGLEAVSHEIADPMGFELRRAMTEARLGRELEECLSGIAERLDSEDFAWVVMAIGIQREVGGNLNELLMTVSDTMIARERLKGEVAALTAEGKISAIMLGGMPPMLGLIMWFMNKEYMNVLLHTGTGHLLMGLATVSSLIGFAWMKKVITVNV